MGTPDLTASSRRRYVGAAVLGLVLIGYVDNALMYTMPRVVSMAQGIEVEAAEEMLSDSP